MTVKELISKLSQLDQDKTIYVSVVDGETVSDAEDYGSYIVLF